jgi:hypothetical protein
MALKTPALGFRFAEGIVPVASTAVTKEHYPHPKKDLLDMKPHNRSIKMIRTLSSLLYADGSKEFFSWVPFVAEIVPDVDMTGRRIKITPPKGLLDMNIKLGPSPAEERRQKVLAQIRRKREISKLRKAFTRAGQEHLFAGLYEGGEKDRDQLLAVRV